MAVEVEHSSTHVRFDAEYVDAGWLFPEDDRYFVRLNGRITRASELKEPFGALEAVVERVEFAFEPDWDSAEDHKKVLALVWKQLAERFSNVWEIVTVAHPSVGDSAMRRHLNPAERRDNNSRLIASRERWPETVREFEELTCVVHHTASGGNPVFWKRTVNAFLCARQPLADTTILEMARRTQLPCFTLPNPNQATAIMPLRQGALLAPSKDVLDAQLYYVWVRYQPKLSIFQYTPHCAI